MADRLATFDDERAFFAYWAPAFEAIMGAPVVVDDRGPADIRLTFPRVFDQIDLIGNTGFFAHRPSMVRYVRELGYDWEEDGRILTCPSPATLNARFDAMVGPDVGWRLGFVVEESGTMAMGPFLRRYLDGFLPIHAGTATFYQTTASAAHARGIYGFHFCSVAHDLSVHALNYHMVPRWAVDRIRTAVSDAMPDRFAAWAAPGATAPLTKMGSPRPARSKRSTTSRPPSARPRVARATEAAIRRIGPGIRPYADHTPPWSRP